jgi:hypothetical protein
MWPRGFAERLAHSAPVVAAEAPPVAQRTDIHSRVATRWEGRGRRRTRVDLVVPAGVVRCLGDRGDD